MIKKAMVVALTALLTLMGGLVTPASAVESGWDAAKARATLAYHLNPPVITAANKHMVGKTTPADPNPVFKTPPPTPPVLGAKAMAVGYNYAVGFQTFAVGTKPYGFQVSATTVQPTLAVGDDHSLMQTAVHRTTSVGNEQIVEFGQAVAPAALGGSSTKLFGSTWTNGSFNGWNALFTDWAGTAPNLGDVIASGVVRCFKTQYSGAAWWLYYGPTCTTGDWVGYFTHANTGWPLTFVDTDKVQAFGEVHINADPTTTDMGNGIISSNASAAVIGSSSNIASPAVTSSLSTWASCAGWTVTPLSTRTFRYGGPSGC